MNKEEILTNHKQQFSLTIQSNLLSSLIHNNVIFKKKQA